MNILKLLVPAIIPVMLIMQGCSSKMSLGEQNARSLPNQVLVIVLYIFTVYLTLWAVLQRLILFLTKRKLLN